jgi:hypothetical protein
MKATKWMIGLMDDWIGDFSAQAIGHPSNYPQIHPSTNPL